MKLLPIKGMIILITKTKKAKAFLALIFVISLVMVSCSFNGSEPVSSVNPKSNEEANSPLDPGNENGEETLNPEPDDTNEPALDPNGSDGPDDPPAGQGTENEDPVIENSGQPSQTTSHVVTAYDENWSALLAVAKAGQAYYTEYFSKTRLISKDGFLYNYASNTSINVKYLCDNEGLNSKYKNDDSSVLLIYGSDLKAYSGVSVKKAEEGLTVFTAKKYGGESKYMVSSASGRCGVILESQYKSLLYKYNQNHGGISRITKNSDEYERILTFIRMYEGKYETYSVRSMVCDNKYAMVILSPNSNKADLRQYILMKTDNIWEVVMSDIEIEPRLLVAVNKVIPDYNTDMIPAYTIADYTIKTDFSDINKILFDKQLITNINQVIYVAGTTTHCYVELFRGNGYLFTRADGDWQHKAVENTKEAFNLLINQGKSKPIFILPDEY